MRKTLEFPTANSDLLPRPLFLRSKYYSFFQDSGLIARCPPRTVGLLNENACRNDLAGRVADFQCVSRRGIDQLDPDIPRGPVRCGIRRYVRDHVPQAEVLHDVVIDPSNRKAGLKHVGTPS